MSESNPINTKTALKRRELLKKLGKNGINYTAPTVLLLLAGTNSFGHNDPTASYASHTACTSASEHTSMGMGMGMSADNHCSMTHGI